MLGVVVAKDQPILCIHVLLGVYQALNTGRGVDKLTKVQGGTVAETQHASHKTTGRITFVIGDGAGDNDAARVDLVGQAAEVCVNH